MTPRRIVPLLLLLLGLCSTAAHAQYFGRNKVQYRSFDFKVLTTEHFDVYYYEDERAAAEEAARMAERWYARLSDVLDHTFDRRQPLILYASHPHFEQTNAISGELGEGTGGVTESMKRRIVLPLAASLAETDHVIGHELVHAFQFDLTSRARSASPGSPAALQMPLWLIEGMAEYLSIGPVDPHTAMWMRDAARHGRLPKIDRLNDPRYFPYRYGHALWAYVAGRFGDRAVGQILRTAAQSGELERAFRAVLGVGLDTLSTDWHQATRAWTETVGQGRDSLGQAARLVIGSQGDRVRLNLAPSISPDGSRVLFYSEKDLLSIELFLADAKSGRVLRRVTRTAVDPHYQSLQFVQSAGSWSPDGRAFAFGAVTRGTPVLTIVDAESGRRRKEIRYPNLGEILASSWSPDGGRIVFSALAGGHTDLYVADVASGSLEAITEGSFSETMPAWSPDGRTIAFATDRYTTELERIDPQGPGLALYDVATRAVRGLPRLGGGKMINPQWSPDGKSLYAIADPDGVPDLYRIDLAGETWSRLTRVLTGVSGLTAQSPALSVARHEGTVLFGGYARGGYQVYALDPERVRPAAAPSPSVAAATLPGSGADTLKVAELIENPSVGLVSAGSFQRKPYRARLSLDAVTQVDVGLAAGTSGVAGGGGAALFWSDMLGNHNLGTYLQIYSGSGSSFGNSFAGVIAYQNLTRRWGWGAEVSQIPYLTRYIEARVIPGPGGTVIEEKDTRLWQTERQARVMTSYPFSRVQRLELSGGYLNIDYEGEERVRLFDQGGFLLSDDTRALAQDTLPSLSLGTASAALVYDTSVFGGTSPVLGQRWRLEASPVAGDLNFVSLLGDYRYYLPLARPFTLAARGLHFGRYGKDGEDRQLYDLFLGYPSLVRGYDDNSFTVDECDDPSGNCESLNRLLGSRLGVANVELRLPLTGGLGIFPTYGVPPIELAAFYDAGAAWTRDDRPRFLGGDRRAVTSYGGAMRINLFGYLVAEIDYVHPNDRPLKGWYWLFSLQPGF